MNFFREKTGSIWPIPQGRLLKMVFKKYGPFWIALDSKIEISCFVYFFRKKFGIFQKFQLFCNPCIWITLSNFNFGKIWQLFFLTFSKNFWNVLDDSQWQVHLNRSNIHSKVFYMLLLHYKQHKSLFFANLMIFKNSWLFS